MSTRAGREAEQRVAEWLRSRGWVIVETNVRVGRDEIDVVARDGDVLVIVEVRARASTSRGHPFDTVGAAKARHLRRAALRYAAKYGFDELRIDVVAVLGDTMERIENAIDFTST